MARTLLTLMCCSAAFADTVTWTTYQDSACTVLCPVGSCATTLDTAATCNQNTESSQNSLVCAADKITYNNYPNTGTISGGTACDPAVECFVNEIEVGVCVEFPGPEITWKKIEASTYTCTGQSTSMSTDTCSTESSPGGGGGSDGDGDSGGGGGLSGGAIAGIAVGGAAGAGVLIFGAYMLVNGKRASAKAATPTSNV